MMHLKLKEYFEGKGISQQEIAAALDVSPPYINAILNGKKPLGKKNAERLANLYGLSKACLLTGDGELVASEDAATEHAPAKDVYHIGDMMELYAQRIRLVDDLRQSLKEELAEVRALKEDLHTAVYDFRDATYRLTQALAKLNGNNNNTSQIGMAADDGQ